MCAPWYCIVFPRSRRSVVSSSCATTYRDCHGFPHTHFSISTRETEYDAAYSFFDSRGRCVRVCRVGGCWPGTNGLHACKGQGIQRPGVLLRIIAGNPTATARCEGRSCPVGD